MSTYQILKSIMPSNSGRWCKPSECKLNESVQIISNPESDDDEMPFMEDAQQPTVLPWTNVDEREDYLELQRGLSSFHETIDTGGPKKKTYCYSFLRRAAEMREEENDREMGYISRNVKNTKWRTE